MEYCRVLESDNYSISVWREVKHICANENKIPDQATAITLIIPCYSLLFPVPISRVTTTHDLEIHGSTGIQANMNWKIREFLKNFPVFSLFNREITGDGFA